MKIELDGNNINSEISFHANIAAALKFPSYYGKNLDALFDVLSADIERPLTLIWKNSDISRKKMGVEFARVVDLLRKVEAQDSTWGLDDRFELRLE